LIARGYWKKSGAPELFNPGFGFFSAVDQWVIVLLGKSAVETGWLYYQT